MDPDQIFKTKLKVTEPSEESFFYLLLKIERRINMALARKCDRCGVFYDRYNEDNTYNICKQFDLCPKCKDELIKWILKGE